MEQLNDKQKEQFAALMKEAKSAGTKYGLAVIGALIVGLVAVNVVNFYFVQNDYFVMAMAFVTGVLVAREGKRAMLAKQADLRAKAQAIIDNK